MLTDHDFILFFIDCHQHPFSCDQEDWKCHDIRNNPRCLRMEQVCDGERDCPYDGSDELNCQDHSCAEGFIKCADNKCVRVSN